MTHETTVGFRQLGNQQPAHWQPQGTLLGFDYGAWRIGVAVGECLIESARPLTTLHNRNAHQIDWQAIAELIDTWKPNTLVLGWPIRDDQTPYPVADYVERFGRRLNGRFGLPVLLVDERLSSALAEQRLGARVAKKAPERIDSGAAAVILETFFAQSVGQNATDPTDS